MAEALDSALSYLRSPEAVRERCGAIFEAVRQGRSRHFRLNLDRLEAVAELTWQVTSAAYPDLRVPLHGRVNHFAAGAVPRLERLEQHVPDARERARALTELVVVSVLLDAGAGPSWRYVEPETGLVFARSEGLAVASWHAVASGLFSLDPARPWRVDAAPLLALTPEQLGSAFQVRPDNPLVGLEGRVALLRRVGEALASGAQSFGNEARLGHFFDVLAAHASAGELPAPRLLGCVLETFGRIWPARTQLCGVELGDVWPHPCAGGSGLSAGLVPFHKLSQWLSYSLVHPLLSGRIEVTSIESLTGLAEYRNGGLFIDGGVLVPLDPSVFEQVHPASSELVVEWRALTVSLLDRLAERLRQRAGLDERALPLGKVLEGGSWAAGRKLAAERRAGAPPLRVQSDGTLF